MPASSSSSHNHKADGAVQHAAVCCYCCISRSRSSTQTVPQFHRSWLSAHVASRNAHSCLLWCYVCSHTPGMVSVLLGYLLLHCQLHAAAHACPLLIFMIQNCVLNSPYLVRDENQPSVLRQEATGTYGSVLAATTVCCWCHGPGQTTARVQTHQELILKCFDGIGAGESCRAAQPDSFHGGSTLVLPMRVATLSFPVWNQSKQSMYVTFLSTALATYYLWATCQCDSRVVVGNCHPLS